jgi:hypothetical protein
MDLTEELIIQMVRRNSPDYEPEFAAMYTEIEREIIRWDNNGKTAGDLTRKILMIFHKHMNNA